MKILFDIQDEYKEPEIHICCAQRSREAVELRDLLEDILSAKITVHRQQETRSVSAHETVRIYSENKKVYLRTKDETFEVKDRLYVLEETLGERGFVRISNSEIVNISQIEKLDMSYSGTIKMYMKNGDETYVSRRYVGRIKKVLS
ncbi:MAG: LytTR family transcriptional regulator [Eubacteriaceae bacterium]|nr:LytTR family transcriptional regulator [Eubacteriaceae bacterium]